MWAWRGQCTGSQMTPGARQPEKPAVLLWGQGGAGKTGGGKENMLIRLLTLFIIYFPLHIEPGTQQ